MCWGETKSQGLRCQTVQMHIQLLCSIGKVAALRNEHHVLVPCSCRKGRRTTTRETV
jgi:hypothetical protein